MNPNKNSNPLKEGKTTKKGNYKIQYKWMFPLFLTDLENNYIKQYESNGIIETMTKKSNIFAHNSTKEVGRNKAVLG